MAKNLQEQQAVRPAVLIAVAAVGVVAVGFFVVNLLMGHKSTPATSGGSAGIIAPAQQPIPNLNIPTDPPAPASSGRDPFQPPAAAIATPPPTPAPAPSATPPAASPKPEFQSTAATKQYVQVLSVALDHKTAAVRDGTIIYEQATPGQTLDRGVVVDSIDSTGKVHMHRGTTAFVLAPGNRVLV